MARLRGAVAGLDDARRGDYAYARGLVKLPSLDAPDISPALFGGKALERAQALLYWLALADRYIPPGLAARLHEGPRRARMAGTTVAFPRAHGWPQLLLRVGALDLTLGGEGGTAGEYTARLAGLTTEPAIYGQPFRFVAQRSAGRAGPRDVHAAGVLDRVREPSRDSLGGSAAGFGLPAFDLPPLRAHAALGEGSTEILLRRTGREIDARWRIHSTTVAWQRLADSGAARSGATHEIDDLVWRTVSGLHDVEIEGRISGALDNPSLVVQSNVGSELARRLRQEIGARVERAERLARARVDSLVQDQVAAARQRLGAAESDVQARLAKQRAELDAVRKDLEARLREMTGGIGIPNLPFPH